MPLVHMKLNDQRLSPQNEKDLLVALTDAVVSVFGEDVRRHTWVIVEGVPPTRWGIGGTPLPS